MFEQYAHDVTEFIRSKCRAGLDRTLLKIPDEDSGSGEKTRDKVLRFLKQKKIDVEHIDFSIGAFQTIKPHNLYTAVCLFGQNPKYNKKDFEGRYSYKSKIGTYFFFEDESCSVKIFANFPRPSENVIFKLMNQAFIF